MTVICRWCEIRRKGKRAPALLRCQRWRKSCVLPKKFSRFDWLKVSKIKCQSRYQAIASVRLPSGPFLSAANPRANCDVSSANPRITAAVLIVPARFATCAFLPLRSCTTPSNAICYSHGNAEKRRCTTWRPVKCSSSLWLANLCLTHGKFAAVPRKQKSPKRALAVPCEFANLRVLTFSRQHLTSRQGFAPSIRTGLSRSPCFPRLGLWWWLGILLHGWLLAFQLGDPSHTHARPDHEFESIESYQTGGWAGIF